jgi:flagellar hook-associated protein 2
MSGISFTGIGSGLPVQDIVSGLVNAERVPFQNRINQKGSSLTSDISANGTLKSVLANLASSLEKLKDADNYQKRSASGGDDFISITADKTAQTGSYDVKVNNLAQEHKVLSKPFDAEIPVGEGQMTFTTPKNTTGFSLDISDTDTLSDVRDKINNSTDNDDVTATIITNSDGKQSLVMTSNSTGLENKLSITATKTDGITSLDPSSGLNDLVTFIDPLSRGPAPADTVVTNLIETTEALDASITVDGQITLTSTTNEFKNAIDGITLTAKKAQQPDDDNSDISVSVNNSLVEQELKKFVEEYNKYYDSAKQLGSSGKGADGSNEAKGALAGDSMLRSVTSKLRSTLSQSFSSDESGGTLSLSQLGIESDQYGKLTLDSKILKEKIEEDPNAIQKFFVGTEDKPGFAASTDGLIQNYTKKDGLIDSRIKGFEGQLDSLDDDMAAFTRKMSKYEARLLSQYNAMDALVAQMRATSDSVQGQLANLPGVVRTSNR